MCKWYIYVKFVKISSPGGRWYIRTLEWLFNKKTTINPNNSKRGDNKFFQSAILIAIHHKELWKKTRKCRKVNKFIQKYNWCGLKYPPHLNDFRRFENKNKDVSLTIFTLEHDSQKPIISYHTKYQDRTHNIKLVTITDCINWHYLAVTNISKLLRELTRT